MIRHERGFTLIELIVTMAVFVFALALISTLFINQLGLFKQQSKIVETKIEGAIGLETMRVDIEQAGLGLPWQGMVAYTESAANPFSLNDAPTGVPKPVVSANNVTTYSGANSIFNGSDYLVIRSVSVARNDASQKWTTLKTGDVKKTWDVTDPKTDPKIENLKDDDRVIVISPGATGGLRNLIVSGINFKDTAAFAPTDSLDTYLIYGINSPPASGPLNTPVRPFNRADYRITTVGSDGTTNIVPQRCAPNTGVLVKAVMNHDKDGTFRYLPLLDCVADMQVVYRLDSDGDGVPDDSYIDDLTRTSVEDIRNKVKEVRVYVLAHEGQRETRYSYPSDTVSIGDKGMGITPFNLKTRIGSPDYKYYRWKVYTIVVQPNNLL